MIDKNTQMKKLLRLFKDTPVLSVQFIIENLKVNSPRKRISDLREKGVPIKDRWVEHTYPDGHTVRYKEYWIEREYWEHDNLL